ncbi:MAG: hypothetical protein ABIJ24_00925 [Nitrospinota bacterium]|nr:zinc ribbon-containing protein [Nitrospinota bacterium]
MENKGEDKGKLEQKYDLLAKKFNELYQAGKERGGEAMSVAMEKARKQLTSLGELSEEQGEVFKKYLARDLDQTMVDAQRLGKEAKEKLNPARLGAGALSSLATILEFTGSALTTLSDKTKKSLVYKTGEITTAGTLTCQDCGNKIHLKETGHVPPCHKCKGTLFDKGY